MRTLLCAMSSQTSNDVPELSIEMRISRIVFKKTERTRCFNKVLFFKGIVRELCEKDFFFKKSKYSNVR